jgi:Homeodomain
MNPFSGSRHTSVSPSPAPSPTVSSYDFEDSPAQVINPRKRPSVAQLQRLQTVFDTSRYITKEQRHTLAREIGLFVASLFLASQLVESQHRDIKFITVWFQNRRQSDKRKAWTRRDRAKKKENSCQRIDTVHLQPAISLDQIASRLERVQRPVLTDKPRPVLSPRRPENVVEPKTPTQSKLKALWTHMPSSPPDAPSSPPSSNFQFLNVSCPVKSGKSLEWACANARMGSKRQRRDNEIRVVRPQSTSPRAAPEKEPESDEVSTPSSSQGHDNRTSRGETAASDSPPRGLSGKSTEDVEAAMVLLQFLRG